LNHASRTKRFALPSRTGLLLALVLAGCQSGGQSDLVTRELRMQEDQIYAMEDYLAQYQQLLCEVRAENAALKRQIAEADDCDTLPAPSHGGELNQRRERAPTRGPSFQSPGRTPADTQRESEEMEIEIIEPDVPPVQKTTSGGPRLEVRGQSPDTPNIVPPQFVQIRGEVVANEAGGGPRLAIEVEPLGATLEPIRCASAVSLMLLEPKQDGPPHSLARWDYSAADMQVLLDEASQRGTMRFHLELPADTPTDRKTEFWVRLMPDGCGKVLGHVPVDLSRPGQFDSMAGEAAPRDGWDERQEGGSPSEIAEPNHSMATPLVSQVEIPTIRRRDDEGWMIARPDRPVQIGAGGESSAAWRAASGPMPVMVESVTPVQPEIPRPVVQQAAFIEAVKTPPQAPPPAPAIRTAVRAAPVWTPERDGEPAGVAKTRRDGQRAAAGPARPEWSPVR
jgi:hypothetical protein